MKLALNSDTNTIDLFPGNEADTNQGDLTTAIIISLFTDRRAKDDDQLPEAVNLSPFPHANMRGWVGDGLAETAGDRIGSRLWLLNREKQTEETRQRAIEYTQEALQWLIDDQHVQKFDIQAEWSQREVLSMRIHVTTAKGTLFSLVLPINGGSNVV